MNKLSEEEFFRLQEQLLQLRTTNYTLREKSTKQDNELLNLKNQLSNIANELAKAQRTINWSKRNKEINVLLEENNVLRKKLQDQEEEFRLQNQTILQEFSSIHAKNDELEKEVSVYKSKDNLNLSKTEVLRMQAENSVLRKKLEGISPVNEHSIISDSNMNNSNCNNLTDDNTSMLGQEGQSSSLDISCDNFQLLLDTEKEEKNLLIAQVNSSEKCIAELQTKLKKKQESIVQLQKEKEDQLTEAQQGLKLVQEVKDKEIINLKELCRRTQTQLTLAQNSLEEARQRSTDLANSGVRFVVSEMENASLNQPEKIGDSEDNANSKLMDLEKQLKHLSHENTNVQIKNEELEQEVLNLKGELVQINKLAEKRKALIDEQALAIQRHQNESDEKIKSLVSNHKTVVEELNQQCDESEAKYESLSKRVSKLEATKKKYEDQKIELRQFREKHLVLEEEIKETKENHDKEKESVKSSHLIELERLTEKYTEEFKSLNTQLEVSNVTCAEYEDIISGLRQEVHDSVEERRLHEKKGLTVVKDLQRQLASERKRADKLQERLSEFIVESSNSKSESLDLKPRDPDATSVSSWSLMSGQNENSQSDGTLESLPGSLSAGRIRLKSELSGSPTAQGLENETQALLGRVTILQQEKWILEERLTFLEQSSSAMADELLHKNAVIQHYCMDGRDSNHSHSSPLHATNQAIKKMAEFVRSIPGDDLGTRDANKKLMGFVEELLSKNMTLEKESEHLAQEVVRLSKNLPVTKMGKTLTKCPESAGDAAECNEEDDYQIIMSEDS